MNKFKQLYRNLSITRKLLLGYAVTLVFALLLAGVLLYSMFKTSLENAVVNDLTRSTRNVRHMVQATVNASIRNYLRSAAESNLQMVRRYYEDFKAGDLTEDQARTAAARMILNQRIGQSGYVYCLNGKGVTVIHPAPGAQGRVWLQHDFVKRQTVLKTGYIEYEWKNPGESAERKKSLYMTYFEPWDWIISATSYRSEFMGLININDFRDKLESVNFGESGYFFVINDTGDFISHPRLADVRFNAVDIRERDFLKDIIRKKNGNIIYKWKNPGETDYREKLAVFIHIPEYDWFVVSSCYLDEVYQPLARLRNTMVLAGLASILLAVIITFVISSFIIRPLKNMMHQFAGAESGDFSVRVPEDYRDEIGQLGHYYNRFMDELEKTTAGLVKEFQERIQVEERYKTLVDELPEGIAMIGPNGRYEYLNNRFIDLFGYSLADLSTIDDWFHKAYPDPEMRREARLNWTGGMGNVDENTVACGNGSEKIIRFKRASLQGGRLLVIYEDVTRQRAVERERFELQGRLRQSQKLEAIGTLASGIAHDFNNILSAIFGYAELARLEAADIEKIYVYLDEILRAGGRARDLVQQILTFSRRDERESKPVSVKLIVKEALKFIRASLPATIEVRQNIRSDSLVMGDGTRIHQILMNLCTNAGHAMKENGGILEVDLKDVELDLDDTANYPDASPGRFINLAVSDTGHGMPPEIQDRIFDPFFTTKMQGEGTGMGLSVVHGIVTGYGGIIRVLSEEGRGTTVNVFLPVIDTPEASDAADTGEPPAGSERILFVDDEPALADVGARMLKGLGYGVVSETSSLKALERFRRRPGEFDLIITDMTMPHMTGDRLAEEILAIRRNIPIIACTGYRSEEKDKIAAELGLAGVLTKPVSRSELARAVRKALDGDGFSG